MSRDMTKPISRREAVKRITTAGAGIALSRGIIRGQSDAMVVAGKRVEIVVSSISPSTIRITLLPVDGGTIPKDGALVAAAAGRTVTRVRALGPPAPIRAGRV